MARKIMILSGSPRTNGNTITLVNWIAEAARREGAEVEVVDAARIDYKVNGCIACMGCQALPEYECVVHDAAAPILARMPEADVLVFATPVYFFGPSAQLKLLMDRMFSLVKIKPDENRLEHDLGGKTMALVVSGGGDVGSGLTLVQDTFKAMAGFLGMRFETLAIPLAPVKTGEMSGNDEARRKAEALGRKLAMDNTTDV